jgi:hypothetical protein
LNGESGVEWSHACQVVFEKVPGMSECPTGGEGSFVYSFLVGWIPRRWRWASLFEMALGGKDNGRGSAENR